MPHPCFQALLSLFPEDSPFCLLPWPLPGYTQRCPVSTLGVPAFPHSLCHLSRSGTQRKPATSEAGRAGAIPTAITRGPSTPTRSRWQRPRPSDAESDIQNRATAPRLGGPHTAGRTHPHPRASLPTQASHRHPPHTLRGTRSPSRGHPAASASRQKQRSWLLGTRPT